MWSGPDYWATGIGVTGLIWAAVSSFMARSAQKNATSATADAKTAGLRAAEALERANELTEKLLTPPPAKWIVEYDHDHGWQLINHTGHVTNGVYIQSVGGEFYESGSTWDRIPPDGQIQLQAVAPFADATITVIWTFPQGGQGNLPITVHSPLAP